MTSFVKRVDMGGLDLTVNKLRIGATKPGQSGTEMTGAEITVLDSVTAGTVAASKAVVVDGNKDIGDFRNLDAVNIDAGASGTAGSVDVFPSTASKGKLSITCADQTGDTTVALNIAAMGQATTITVPDPGTASASVVLTAGNQTIAGVKTFSAIPVFPTTGITLNATTITETEIGVLDGAVAGTPAANKAIVTSGSNDVAGVRHFAGTGILSGHYQTATPAAASAVAGFTMGSANIGLYWGTGSPDTVVTAPQGSLYIRTDGSSTSTRLYINTNGTTGWTSITTAA